MTFEYWYMFPVAITVSTVAISAGVSGATFFTPMFFLWLGLPLRAAIGAALMTATFGFASGLSGYARRGLIDYALGARLMAPAVPMTLLGVWSAGRIDPTILRLVLSVGLLAIAASFWQKEADPGSENASIEPGNPSVALGEGTLFAAVGGFFLGMVSAGLGELNAYFLMKRSRMPSARAVATSVLVLAGTCLAAAGGHLVEVLRMEPAVRSEVASLVMFTIPGVVIGAQIGCLIGSRAPRTILLRSLGVLFAIVALVIVVPLLAGR